MGQIGRGNDRLPGGTFFFPKSSFKRILLSKRPLYESSFLLWLTFPFSSIIRPTGAPPKTYERVGHARRASFYSVPFLKGCLSPITFLLIKSRWRSYSSGALLFQPSSHLIQGGLKGEHCYVLPPNFFLLCFRLFEFLTQIQI